LSDSLVKIEGSFYAPATGNPKFIKKAQSSVSECHQKQNILKK
jgi:hypothetical protein